MTLAVGNALAVLALVTALWLVSIKLRDVSIIDPWWSIASLLVCARSVWVTGLTPGKALLLAMVSAWALRLFVHLLVRSIGKPEDPRYAAFRRRYGPDRYWWFSFFQVFLLQGALALVASAPLAVAGAAVAPDPIAWNDVAAAILFTLGFVIEAVADAQLARFRASPESRGRVLDRGLFRWSRHPNYFGETLVAWAFWLAALDARFGAFTIVGPAMMTWLLLRVSGVSMLDEHMMRTKPGYAEYMRRTSAFFPRPPGR